MTTPNRSPSPSSNNDRERILDVADHPVAWRWMKETARQDPNGFARLFGANNTERLRRLYGDPAWTSSNQDGWQAGWLLPEQGLQWIVLTGAQGTVFRLQLSVPPDQFINDSRCSLGLTTFLTSLLKTLAEGY